LRAITFSILSCGSSVARLVPAWLAESRNLFQYPILRIVGCKESRPHPRPCPARRLSVSYPADRRLQGGRRRTGGGGRKPFQYPILRIVGCKGLGSSGGYSPSRLSVSYPADRRLQASMGIGWLPSPTSFSILSCGSSVASGRLAGPLLGGPGPFSILSCGSSVARVHGQHLAPTLCHFQYPILRIVGCKTSLSRLVMNVPNLSVSYPADRRLQDQLEQVGDERSESFSILSCGSSVAREVVTPQELAKWPDFQYPILRIVGCKLNESGLSADVTSLSVSYPADRRLQGRSWPTTSPPWLRLSVSYPADRRLQARPASPGRASATTFSILSCGSSVASCAFRSFCCLVRHPFSILSCGSSVARFWNGPRTAKKRRAFSILSCGSSVARV